MERTGRASHGRVTRRVAPQRGRRGQEPRTNQAPRNQVQRTAFVQPVTCWLNDEVLRAVETRVKTRRGIGWRRRRGFVPGRRGGTHSSPSDRRNEAVRLRTYLPSS